MESQLPTMPSRHPEVERHLDAAARHRRKAEELVATIEEAVHEYAALHVVPLDVAQRAAHAVVELNAANLAHVGTIPDELLEEAS